MSRKQESCLRKLTQLETESILPVLLSSAASLECRCDYYSSSYFGQSGDLENESHMM